MSTMHRTTCQISDTLAAGRLMFNQLSMPGAMERFQHEDVDAANDALMVLAQLVDHITGMPIEVFSTDEIQFVNSVVEFLTATLPSGPEDAPENWEESS